MFHVVSFIPDLYNDYFFTSWPVSGGIFLVSVLHGLDSSHVYASYFSIFVTKFCLSPSGRQKLFGFKFLGTCFLINFHLIFFAEINLFPRLQYHCYFAIQVYYGYHPQSENLFHFYPMLFLVSLKSTPPVVCLHLSQNLRTLLPNVIITFITIASFPRHSIHCMFQFCSFMAHFTHLLISSAFQIFPVGIASSNFQICLGQYCQNEQFCLFFFIYLCSLASFLYLYFPQFYV